MAKIKKDQRGKKKESGSKNVQSMQFNRSLGQHILKNPLVVQALVEKVRAAAVNDNLVSPLLPPVGAAEHRHCPGDWAGDG
jgi:hypothetical protein